MAVIATGADDQGCRVACGEALRVHEDAVIGRAVRGEIDDRRGVGAAGDRDEWVACVAGQALVFRAVAIVDHGEVGGLALSESGPARWRPGIVGEADMKVRRARAEDASCDGAVADRDAGARTGKNSMRANTAATISGTTEARILKRNMIRTA